MSRHGVAGRWGAFACAVALATGCGGGSGAPTSAQAPSAPGAVAAGDGGAFVLVDAEVKPYAVWSDEVASTSITVTVRTRDDEGVELALEYFDGLAGGSGVARSARLYDDGSHGDVVAGDGVWTRAFVPDVSEPAELRLYEGQVDVLPMAVVARRADGDRVAPANAIDARLELGLVSRTLDGEFETTALAADARATSHVVNLRSPGFDGADLGSVMRRVYDVVGADAFDFAVVFSTRSTGDAIPRSMGVRNDVRGIHRPIFDDSRAYGSRGRLQQIVYQNAHVAGLEINHELGHRWGAFLDDPALNLAIPTGFHWGPSTHVGQMGNGPFLLDDEGSIDDGGDGFLVTNAHGSEKFLVNPFSPLELYLMGLAGADEVAPLRFVTDPAVNVAFGARLPEASTRVVTIEDIEAVYGERVPRAAESQNAFGAVFVVVSDRTLTSSELALSSAVARYYGGTAPGGERSGGLFTAYDPPSFPAATGYRATLETALPLSGP
jgi:hypothetical protein